MASQTYNYSQLRSLWIQAGGSRVWSYVMAAIAMAESHGNPSAHHVDSDGSVDWGLWQINSVHFKGDINATTMQNPQANAAEAVKVFKSSGPGAWSTYNNGAYKQYMPGGQSTPSKAFGIYTPADEGQVDQGVDFSGKGVVPALDNALITDVGTTHIIETGNKTWHYVIYLLREGPYKGHYVYVAENIKPNVHPGQIVQKGQEIATAQGQYPYTETGFNRGGKGWNAYGSPTGGPQVAGKTMKKYIDSIMGTGTPVTVTNADPSGADNTSGGGFPNPFSGIFSGIESALVQGFFILIGIALIMVGLGLVAWAVLGRTGPGIIGAVQTQQRINQSGARTQESQRASMVRESQAGSRIEGQTASRELSRERLDVQRQNQERRQERYVVKDKPNQVVRKKAGTKASGVPRR